MPQCGVEALPTLQRSEVGLLSPRVFPRAVVVLHSLSHCGINPAGGRSRGPRQEKPTMATKDVQVSEQESRKVAEASRETEWKQPSFMREMFLGNFRLDLIDPYPLPEPERPEVSAFFSALKEFMRTEVDSVEIDATGEYPEHVLDGFRKLGAFGMKIPRQYGGLGFTNVEYQKVMQLLGGLDGN